MGTVRRVRQDARMTMEELIESLRPMPEITQRLDGIARQVAAIQEAPGLERVLVSGFILFPV